MKNIDKSILLIDGECLLCDRFLKFVLKHDRQKRIFYAHLQSFPIENLPKRELPQNGIKTVFLWHNGKLYEKSDVTIVVFALLGGIWKVLSYFIRVCPKLIRDSIYDLVARYRYKIWGKADACLMPTEEIKGRFLG